MTPEEAHQKAKNAGKRLPELENIILTSPCEAYEYACDVVKGRWREAEDIIATNNIVAFYYATNVVQGRWKKAEDIIATDCYCAYHYAALVIKGRFKKAEKMIADYDYYNQLYLLDVFDQKPPLDYAVKSSYGLYFYAKNVIKGKLPTELHNRMLCFAIVEPNARHIKTYFKSKKYQ